MIKGITVTLYERTQSGTDAFNRPEYTETETTVDNVLVAPVSSDAVVDEMNLSGKKLVYYLMVPKGDNHTWQDRRVSFYGETWRVFDCAEEWIGENTPGAWNRRYKVERYE